MVFFLKKWAGAAVKGHQSRTIDYASELGVPADFSTAVISEPKLLKRVAKSFGGLFPEMRQRDVYEQFGFALKLVYDQMQEEREGEEIKKFTNVYGMTFVWIEPGSFDMGSHPSEPGRVDEKQHLFTLDNKYSLMTTPVTQGQWKAIMDDGNNPSHFKDSGDNYPVENVSFDDIQTFLSCLNETTDKIHYRLPEEAEWEYAAKSGGRGCLFSGGNDLQAVAWNDRNSGGETHPIGKKQPNRLGLYDMTGNVCEWCNSMHSYYPDHTPGLFHYRIIRGGGFQHTPVECRVAYRTSEVKDFKSGTVGFRLAGEDKVEWEKHNIESINRTATRLKLHLKHRGLSI